MKADLSSRALVRNTGWNVIGYAAPAMVAVICIPPLLRALGIERFGILTLAWVLIGYLGLFDLGIGRALTKLIAERRATSTQTELASLAQTALVALLGLGFVGTLAGLALSGLLAREVLAIPAPLQAEAAKSLAILFLALPLVVSSAALAGLLEAFQRFDLVNAVRVPLGIASFVFPLGASALSPDLITVALSLVAVRLAGWIGYFWLANRLLSIADRWRFKAVQVPELLRLGGWMMVSSVVGPLMVYLDRFVLGARTTMSAVAYYATPFELITKLLVVPSAVGGVLFPGFASLHAADPSGFRRLGRIGTALILAALFPVALALVLFAGELLAMWLDAEFARHSRRVVQWLALGTFLNAAAHVPFAALQAAGRPDLTAKLHLAELPLYLGGLALGVSLMGIDGAAIAWTMRVTIDTVLLYALARAVLGRRGSPGRTVYAIVGGCALALVLCMLTEDPRIRLMALVVLLAVFGISVWRFLLSPRDRAVIASGLRTLSSPRPS